jgi:hypothetical protein
MRHIEFNTEEIEEYVYNKLVLHGFAVTQKNAETIAEIVFDYLVDKGVVTEIYDEDDEFWEDDED